MSLHRHRHPLCEVDASAHLKPLISVELPDGYVIISGFLLSHEIATRNRHHPGDVMPPNEGAASGDEVYVELLTGERLLKVAQKMRDGWLLKSYNQAYEPRFMEHDRHRHHACVWSRRRRK